MLLDHDLGNLRRFGLDTQAELKVFVLVITVPVGSVAVVIANVGSQCYFVKNHDVPVHAFRRCQYRIESKYQSWI